MAVTMLVSISLVVLASISPIRANEESLAQLASQQLEEYPDDDFDFDAEWEDVGEWDATIEDRVCPPPPSPQKGYWECDFDNRNCYLKCDAGYTSPASWVRCQNGVWEQENDEVECILVSLETLALGLGPSAADSVDPEFLERMNNWIMDEARARFKSQDKDGDGKITAQDYLIRAPYKGQNNQTLEDYLFLIDWQIYPRDNDGDNALNLREFAGIQTKDEVEALNRRFFKVIDTDDNDLITENEMREVERRFGVAENDIDQYIEHFFNDMDHDKDGTASLQEVMDQMRGEEERLIRRRLDYFTAYAATLANDQ